MTEHILTGASGREYKIFPQEVAWTFSSDADHIDDPSEVTLVVGRMDGDTFVPMDIMWCKNSILPYFGQWGSGQHWAREAGATHFTTIWADGDEFPSRDLMDAYPTGVRAHPPGR